MEDWLSDIMVVVVVVTVWIGLQRAWNSAIQSSDDCVGEVYDDVGGDIEDSCWSDISCQDSCWSDINSQDNWQ